MFHYFLASEEAFSSRVQLGQPGTAATAHGVAFPAHHRATGGGCGLGGDRLLGMGVKGDAINQWSDGPMDWNGSGSGRESRPIRSLADAVPPRAAAIFWHHARARPFFEFGSDTVLVLRAVAPPRPIIAPRSASESALFAAGGGAAFFAAGGGAAFFAAGGGAAFFAAGGGAAFFAAGGGAAFFAVGSGAAFFAAGGEAAFVTIGATSDSCSGSCGSGSVAGSASASGSSSTRDSDEMPRATSSAVTGEEEPVALVPTARG